MPERRARSRFRRWWDPFAFVGTALLFLCSFLVWFSAPTATLWITAIIITEWGHLFAIALFIGGVSAWLLGNRWTAALALLAALNCASPLLRAMAVARALPERCAAAFGESASTRRPLEVGQLFFGVSTAGVRKTELVYAEKSLKLDLYQPENMTAPQPLIVMIHGGSWNGGNRAQLPAFPRFLAQGGYAVASISYRHAPKHPFPAAVDDVFRAIDFLKRHAVEARIDVTRVVLIGRSAGGQLALSAAYSGREPAIRGVVSFYGPSDLVLGYEHPSRRWVLDSKSVLEKYLGGPPTAQPERYAAASPINFVNAATPPTLLIHGSLDPTVWPEQSQLLAARLQSSGRPHLLLQLPWGTHGCDAALNGPSGQLSLYAIDRFLRATLRSDAEPAR
jgi:acetyl esterase/lipase